MNNKLLLAIDQGTTSSRAILFSKSGEIVGVRQKELELFYPHKGWVEQNPENIWQDVLWACREVIKKAPEGAEQVAAIGITNQRETTIIWDRDTGEPIYNAIVWQDRRTADICEKYREEGVEYLITTKTGLLIDPYFSATKIKWILDNVEGARKKAEEGKLAFGTIDSFLLWKLTGGKVHATDITNASRTMIFNIHSLQWDEELLDLFDIPRSLLPEVKENVADFGITEDGILQQNYQIGAMAGDQHAALVGQACFREAMVKATYGTGCFALMNIGRECKISRNRLLTTPAYKIGNDMAYAIEGSIFNAGAGIQWLRDNMGIIDDVAETEKIAMSVDNSNGVYFIPAFTGLGAPYWNAHARAAIVGLTRESNSKHIVRAALEAQAYQTMDLMEAMISDGGYNPSIIRVDGGLVKNGFVCQFLADMLNKPVDVPKVEETTALGAAYLAGLQCGMYDGLYDIEENWHLKKRYENHMQKESRKNHYEGWRSAIEHMLI